MLSLLEDSQHDELLVELGAFGVTMRSLAMRRGEGRMCAVLAALI